MRSALWISLVFAATLPAYAYRPRIVVTDPVASTYASGGYFSIGGQISVAALSDKTGIAINLPLRFGDGACKTDRSYAVFNIQHSVGTVQTGDTQHRTAVRVDLNLYRRAISISFTDTPTVDGVEARQSITYTYPILDRLPFDCKISKSSSAIINEIDMQIYFNESNMVITAQQAKAPLSKAFVTPINMGVGQTIMADLVVGGTPAIFGVLSDVSTDIAQPVTLSGFYWWRTDNLNNPPAARPFDDLLDDLNWFYGEKAYPVRSPLLEYGANAAAAAYVTIQGK